MITTLSYTPAPQPVEITAASGGLRYAIVGLDSHRCFSVHSSVESALTWFAADPSRRSRYEVIDLLDGRHVPF